MKKNKIAFEEAVGIIIGLVLWYLWAFVNMAMSTKNIATITIIDRTTSLHFLPIHSWIFAGPAIFFISLCQYLVSHSVIDEKKKTEDIISIKSNLIGFFLWLILLIFAYLLNIQINSYISQIGGFLTILLIYLYMEKKVAKQKLSDVTFTKLLLILLMLNTLINAFQYHVPNL
jgi:hypothetical protein